MKCAGIESEELKLEHVRDVRERKPVCGGPVSEGPLNAVPLQTRVDFRNFVNVFRIVVINEWKRRRLPKHGPDECYQPGADAESKIASIDFARHSLGLYRAAEDASDTSRHL